MSHTRLRLPSSRLMQPKMLLSLIGACTVELCSDRLAFTVTRGSGTNVKFVLHDWRPNSLVGKVPVWLLRLREM